MRAKESLLTTYSVGIITSVLTPYMLNPSAWNWGNYTGFFWAGLCFFCIVYTYFRVPEPRGRSFAELDVLFERRVSARKFAETEVDVFDESVDANVVHDASNANEIHLEKEANA